MPLPELTIFMGVASHVKHWMLKGTNILPWEIFFRLISEFFNPSRPNYCLAQIVFVKTTSSLRTGKAKAWNWRCNSVENLGTKSFVTFYSEILKYYWIMLLNYHVLFYRFHFQWKCVFFKSSARPILELKLVPLARCIGMQPQSLCTMNQIICRTPFLISQITDGHCVPMSPASFIFFPPHSTALGRLVSRLISSLITFSQVTTFFSRCTGGSLSHLLLCRR